MAQWFPNAGQALQYLEQKTTRDSRDEARQKVVKDHQTIHERKSLQVCIPILPGTGHDQVAWFQKLDRNGIWEKVMRFLIDPSDVTSAYFSCEMFKKHLEEKRRDILLLPKVFRVLRDTGRLQYFGFRYNERNISASRQEESREILKLRLISKAWKATAEESFLVPLMDLTRPAWCRSNWKWQSPMVCQFKSVEDVDGAITKLRDPSSSASLVRLLSVDYQEKLPGEREPFYSKLGNFLNYHGESIWGLQIFLNSNSTISCRFNYERLCNIVSKTPHLKTLFVWNPRSVFVSGTRTSAAGPRRSVFPSVPTLELCRFAGLRMQDNWVVAQVLNRNQNLKAVSLSYKCEDEEDGHGYGHTLIPPFVWDALQSLKLRYFTCGFDNFAGERHHFMHNLDRLEECDWPLKHLTVGYVGRGNPNMLDLDVFTSEILRVLRRFNDSLEVFSFLHAFLRLVSENRDGDGGDVVVDFPNLKQFQFRNITRYI